VTRVVAFIQLHAEPRRRLAHTGPNDGRALPDAGREDDRIEAAERRCQCSELLADGVDEVVDGKFRPRVGAGEKLPHVVAHARQTEQTRLAIG
jgi:hypothetical protein